ncbi:hypothetical protein CMUS01_03223 [Colletotrichum musicola]|uniref:Uncharacterized protein n=1 Tax=Colletotrichum musicola TaxID=2175873 RepID=A0A8H6NTL0_9PEZI|nr:hypothetical protein CMUS01_03223 [Colletotrichum musicola]
MKPSDATSDPGSSKARPVQVHASLCVPSTRPPSRVGLKKEIMSVDKAGKDRPHLTGNQRSRPSLSSQLREPLNAWAYRRTAPADAVQGVPALAVGVDSFTPSSSPSGTWAR